MSCNRSHVLRQQKSCASDGGDMSTGLRCRERRFPLQKQFSFDQGHIVRHYGCNRGDASMAIPTKNNFTKIEDILPEASLQVFNAFNTKGNGETSLKVSRTSAKKISNRLDEKININIFLAQNISIPELEIPSDSDVEANVKTKNTVHESGAPNNKLPSKNGAQTKRHQFHSHRSTSASDNRPRLMRAMSAPIRPNDAQTKKCFRRKKIVPMDQSDPFQFQFTHHQQQQSPSLLPQHKPKSVVDRKDEQISMRPLTCRPKIKVSKIPMQSRPQSAINGCDIVTLVSLLSPGGSDSEKEDHSTSSCNNKSDVTCTERRGGPSLRKMGKSVSFQDDDDCFDSNDANAIDLSTTNIRRASFAPLASKIRMNRPPTAPPGSIFARSMFSETDMTSSSELFIDDKSTTHQTIPKASTEKAHIDAFDVDKVYPEYVRSIKEKECWILFQKMINKGISVSYETIMRGMLTPTEVRAVEKKQREIFERQSSLELETEPATAAVSRSKK